MAELSGSSSRSCSGSGNSSSSVASKLQSGVSRIFSNNYAFAALKNDRSVVSWGAGWAGGTHGVQVSGGVSDVSSTFHGGFAALKDDGSVVTWGSSSYGGNSSSVSQYLKSGVVEIISNEYAFAALKDDG